MSEITMYDEKTTDTDTQYIDFKINMIDKRLNFGSFLCSDFKFLHYETQCKIITDIYNNFNISLHDMFYGKSGSMHNTRMQFNILPNIELYKMIISIMNTYNINKLEELDAGIGLFTQTMQFINSHYLENPDEKIQPIESIKGYEPKYFLETSQKLSYVTLDKRDIYELILNNTSDIENTAYIIVGALTITNYSHVNLMNKLCNLKKPKLVMVLSYKKVSLDTFIEGYTSYKFYPKIISKYDSITYNLNKNSNMILYTLVRNDITPHVPLNIQESQFEEFKTNSVSLFHSFVENKIVPKCCINIKEYDADTYIQKMYEYKMTSLPLHFESLDEISSYFFFLQIALETNGNYMPDILYKRENFLNLRKYIDLIYSNFNELYVLGVIPYSITSQTRAIQFLIKDYCYSDKLRSEVFRCFID